MAGNLGAALPLAASVARAVPLAAGQATLATVQGDAQSGFSVQLAGRSIALPPEGSWSAGQQVQLRATVEAGVLRVDVTALSSPTPPDAPGSLSRLVAALLPSLGLSLSADDAVAVLPGALPATASAMTSLLGILFSGPAPKEALGVLARWLQQAEQAGRLSPEAARAAAPWLALAKAPAAQWPQLLQQLVQDAGAEAQLAKGNLPDSLRSALALLLRDGVLKGAAEDAAQTLLSRLDSAAGANVRALDRSYFFLELPFLWLPGFQRAQAHVFSDGSKDAQGDAKTPATVVLDLELESLGPVWVSLRRDAATCVCEITADDTEAREMFDAEKQDLVDALAAAGLPHPAVRVRAPAEERAQRLVALLRGGQPLDQTA